MNVELRRLELRDLNAIEQIERESYPTPWSRSMFAGELAKPSSLSLGAFAPEGGALVGYLVISRYVDAWHVMNIAVTPPYRRQGIARALLEHLFAVTASDERRGYTLEVRVSNEGAIKLYEAMGFVARGVRRGYYTDNREDALIMWRDPVILGSAESDRRMRLREGLPEPLRSNGADAVHIREVNVSRIDDCVDVAEMRQERPSRDRRDVWDGCQHGFGGRFLRTLRVDGPVSRRPSGSGGDAVQPERRIALGFAADDGDAVLAGREQCAANGRRRDRPSVERWPFDEENGRLRRRGAAQLPPEPARRERQVQIAHGLAFDDASPVSVVPDRKFDPHICSEPVELLAISRGSCTSTSTLTT